MFKITQPPVIIFGKHSVRDYSFPENCLIVTSRGASTRGWLDYLKLNSYNIFDKVVTSDDTKTFKPSKIPFERILKHFNSF